MYPKSHAQVIQNGRKGLSGEYPRPIDPSYSESSAAEDAHNTSQFVRQELRSSWSNLANIKKSARTEWTIPSIKARIAEMKLEHRQQLAKALKHQCNEGQQMVTDEYRSCDELENLEHWSPEAVEALKGFQRLRLRLRMHQSESFDARLHYIHIMSLKPLYEKLQKLLVAEESAKAHRARVFPRSSQAWREMDTRDAKLKVAKFLLMDKKQQDEVVHREVVWRENKADVDRVVLEYKSNVVFAQEVRTFVKENQTTDPRRRAT